MTGSCMRPRHYLYNRNLQLLWCIFRISALSVGFADSSPKGRALPPSDEGGVKTEGFDGGRAVFVKTLCIFCEIVADA